MPGLVLQLSKVATADKKNCEMIIHKSHRIVWRLA